MAYLCRAGLLWLTFVGQGCYGLPLWGRAAMAYLCGAGLLWLSFVGQGCYGLPL